MKFLLPIILAFVGLGAGVGAGLALRPEPESYSPSSECDCACTKPDAQISEELPESTTNYIKLNNQFVVPIVESDRVAALVVMTLSLGAPNELTETVYQREPKLRDVLLQALFDHANTGGFSGNFTQTRKMQILHQTLVDAAQHVLGPQIVDVAISDIARQDL